jgi:SAM-dependent methyltransferase
VRSLYDNYQRTIAPDGVMRRLVVAAQLREIRRQVGFAPGEQVLEIGCDAGVLLRRIEATGAVVHGIEVNPRAVELARHARVRLGSAEDIPFPAGSFDACIAAHVIEHLDEPRRLLCEAARVLVPGGALVLLYPWELFQGMSVIPEVLLAGQPLRMIREVHKHALVPRAVQRLAADLPLVHQHSHLFLGLPDVTPQYLTIFRRRRA